MDINGEMGECLTALTDIALNHSKLKKWIGVSHQQAPEIHWLFKPNL